MTALLASVSFWVKEAAVLQGAISFLSLFVSLHEVLFDPGGFC